MARAFSINASYNAQAPFSETSSEFAFDAYTEIGRKSETKERKKEREREYYNRVSKHVTIESKNQTSENLIPITSLAGWRWSPSLSSSIFFTFRHRLMIVSSVIPPTLLFPGNSFLACFPASLESRYFCRCEEDVFCVCVCVFVTRRNEELIFFYAAAFKT